MTDEENFPFHDWHRKIAVDCFNNTWNIIDMKDRNRNDEINMIHLAHTSRFHWGVLVEEGKGKPINLQRGEWLISRVYSILNKPKSAVYHAEICLEITLDNDIGDFDLAFAYEAMTRASAANRDKDSFEKYDKLAKEAGEKIEKEGDKTYFFKDLEAGNWFNFK